ncbi:MAG: RNA polymerase factor sigma-54 [Bacteroidales bacterium]|jgi:RNA polymerase sigma-54 factor|nr:RNA polymerase factor sigma-54 [Bacteroidales bacterium]
MLRQQLTIKQTQRLSPQQIIVERLLPLTTMEIEQRVKQEVEENPALEMYEDDDIFHQEVERDDNYSNEYDEEVNIKDSENSRNTEEMDFADFFDEGDVEEYKLRNTYYDDRYHNEHADNDDETLTTYLLDQLNYLDIDKKKKEIAEVVINSLTDDGYLPRTVREINNELILLHGIYSNEQEVKKVLTIVRNFDPAGIAAYDLQECLRLQLDRKKETASVKIAKLVIDRVFDYFTHKRYDYIVKRLGITEEDLQAAINEILKLHPKPGVLFAASASVGNVSTVVPDFRVLVLDDDKLEVLLNAYNEPKVFISKDFETMLNTFGTKKQLSERDKEANSYVKTKIESANYFIEALKIRNNTLLKTMSTIAHIQKSVFLSGDMSLMKPLKLQDVAEYTLLDVSTISRVINSKFVETFFGVFPLKKFFSLALTKDDGKITSATNVKEIIKKIIEEEDKINPLRDEALTDMLQRKGIKIARRTVAKYRESIGIPSAGLRKIL